MIQFIYVKDFNLLSHKNRSDSSSNMKNLPNMRKNVTFQMVFVKNESGRIRVHPQSLYMLCIIIKYNFHFNILDEHECDHFSFTRKPSKI